VPNIYIYTLSFIFINKNNNILQLDNTLNNEGSMLESFFQILGMANMYFIEFLENSKIIN